MYVCICNQITDSQIRDAVADGATDIQSLQQRLDVAKCCGRCKDFAQEVINEAMAAPWASIAITHHSGSSLRS